MKRPGGALLALVVAFACASAPVRAQTPKASASGPAAPAPAAAAADSFDVDAALAKLDAALRWDPLSRIGSIETVRHRIVFRAEAVKSPPAAAILDGAELILASPPYLADGTLRFPADFVSAVLGAFNRAAEVERSRFRVAAILVDPGHGGRDAGAVGRHVINGKKLEIKEKDVVLDVSRDLFDRLSKTYPDKRILMTRTGDTYPTLEQRVDIANSVSLAENEAILFVSIHANASFNKTARGYEVWYLSPERSYRTARTCAGNPRRYIVASRISLRNSSEPEDSPQSDERPSKSLRRPFAASRLLRPDDSPAPLLLGPALRRRRARLRLLLAPEPNLHFFLRPRRETPDRAPLSAADA